MDNEALRGPGYADVQNITTPIVLAGYPRPAKSFARGWEQVERAEGQRSQARTNIDS